MQQDLEEEGIDHYGMQHRNNKPLIDTIMNSPDGLFFVFDNATKNCEENCHYITSNNRIRSVDILNSKILLVFI